MKNKFVLSLLLLLGTLGFSQVSFSQNIPSTDDSTTRFSDGCSGNQAPSLFPTQWWTANIGATTGTCDCSSVNSGALSLPWTLGTVPTPPTGHDHFVSCGSWESNQTFLDPVFPTDPNAGLGEAVSTPMSGLTVGETYTLTFYVAGFTTPGNGQNFFSSGGVGNSYAIAVGNEQSGNVFVDTSVAENQWIEQTFTFTADSPTEQVVWRGAVNTNNNQAAAGNPENRYMHFSFAGSSAVTVGAPDATLTLLKEVDNSGGGTAVDTDFTLTASGATNISGVEGDASITSATVTPDRYTFSESTVANYQLDDIVCTGAADGQPNSNGRLDIAAGEDVTCTFMNTFVPLAQTSVSIAKTATVDPIVPGTPFDFILTVTDASDGTDASNVVVTDLIDSSLTINSVTASDSGTTDSTGPEVGCTWTTIPDSATRTCTINVTLP